MKVQILVVTFLIANCQALTITGSKDAEYVAVEMAGRISDCFISVLIQGCNKPMKLEVYYKADDSAKEVNIKAKQTKACLPVKCTISGSKTSLSDEVDILGDSIQTKPEDLKEGMTSDKIYKNIAECSKGSPIATVTCVKKVTNNNLELEEFEDENSDSMTTEQQIELEEFENEMAYTQQDSQKNKLPLQSDNDNDNDDDDTLLQDESNTDTMQSQDDIDDTAEKSLGHDDIDSEALAQDENGVTAKIQWNNWFRSTFGVNCGNRRGIYYVRSGHSNYYKDRIWAFYCKTVTNINFNHCYWTGYQNGFDLPLFSHCGANYIMTGMYSRFSAGHRDRQFSLLCCRAPYYQTRACYLSGYVNGWGGFMSYGVGGARVFTGLSSYHDNGREDRIWRISNCWYSR